MPAKSTRSVRSSNATPRESSPQRTVLAAVQSRTFAPVYYAFGDDDYLKDVAINDLLNAALDPSSRDFNCELRRASDLDAEAVNDILGTPPMLAERRAVVIRDVNTFKKAARAQLDKYLARPAADVMLILTSPAGTKTDDALTRVAVALNFEPLSPERVRKWITHHAETELRISIADDAVQLLQQAVGNDLQMLANELDKCASYVQGIEDAAVTTSSGVTGASSTNAGITSADLTSAGLTRAGLTSAGLTGAGIDVGAVSAVVGVRHGETATDLLDAVARHDAALCVKLLTHVLSQPKVNAVQLVMMLSTQTFALAYGRARRDGGVPTGRLASEFFTYLKETGGYPGRPWGEAASAWAKNVDSWSASACERALALLLEADSSLKDTTISNAEQTMTTLVLALCALKPRNRKAA